MGFDKNGHVTVRIPKDFWPIIDTENLFHSATQSQYFENLLKNGIAIQKMYQEYEASNNDEGTIVVGHIIRTGIKSIKQKNEMEFILDTHVLPENASARLIELKKDLLAHERKHTVLVLPDDLTEYLDKCSVECGESTNLMIFMFLQISLSCWWTKSNPQIFKGLDPKKVDNIFDETQNISIEFKYENDILKFDLIKKTKISPMTKTLAGLPVMGKTQTQKREGGT